MENEIWMKIYECFNGSSYFLGLVFHQNSGNKEFLLNNPNAAKTYLQGGF